jgi:hypothetical protein
MVYYYQLEAYIISNSEILPQRCLIFKCVENKLKDYDKEQCPHFFLTVTKKFTQDTAN